jgi:hypothetical protein
LIHPIIAGTGEALLRETQDVGPELGATKSFSKIVKLTFYP